MASCRRIVLLDRWRNISALYYYYYKHNVYINGDRGKLGTTAQKLKIKFKIASHVKFRNPCCEGY